MAGTFMNEGYEVVGEADEARLWSSIPVHLKLLNQLRSSWDGWPELQAKLKVQYGLLTQIRSSLVEGLRNHVFLLALVNFKTSLKFSRRVMGVIWPRSSSTCQPICKRNLLRAWILAKTPRSLKFLRAVSNDVRSAQFHSFVAIYSHELE